MCRNLIWISRKSELEVYLNLVLAKSQLRRQEKKMKVQMIQKEMIGKVHQKYLL